MTANHHETHQNDDQPENPGNDGNQRTRRNALVVGTVAVGAAVGVAAVAACGSGDSSSGSGTQPSVAPGQPLAKVADIQVGEGKAVTTSNGQDAIVVRTSETTVAAFSAICTHQGCKVAPAGAELHCPCHGSVFDTLTGAVKKGPAQQPLPSIAVKINNGEIVSA